MAGETSDRPIPTAAEMSRRQFAEQIQKIVQDMQLRQWAVNQAVTASTRTNMTPEEIQKLTGYFYEFATKPVA